MKRTVIAVVVTVTALLAAIAVARQSGWIHFGQPTAASQQAEAADEHAGHDMSAMQPQTQAVDEHAGHDMSAMQPQEEAMPAGAVMISPERQQLIGVRTVAAARGRMQRDIRAVGRIEYDERLVAHIHTHVSGWIERLHVDFTGKEVERGEPLLDIYSPDLVSTQEEYLLALRAQSTLGESRYADIARASRELLEAARRRLQLWDITDAQIAELEARGEPQTSISVHSPIRGFVIQKDAFEGQFVGPERELFTIADLSRVWLTADVYEQDLPLVRIGQMATVTLSYISGRTYRGKVEYIYPYLDPENRTGKVRLALDNPRTELKPEMFANVVLTADLGEGVLVPEDALIDSGERQLVLIALPGGHFLPRAVVAGGRFGDLIEIREGLQDGELVVSAATFLIDSESKLASALRDMAMSGHQH